MTSLIVLSVLVTLTAAQTCPRGTAYTDNCNVCTCNLITGAVSCTLRGCTASNKDIEDVALQAQRSRFDPSRKVCSPALEFDPCRKCTCSDDGLSYKCQHERCNLASFAQAALPFRSKPTKHCPRGVVYEDGCGHTCKCNMRNGNTNCPPGFCDKPDPPIEDKPESRSPWGPVTKSENPFPVPAETRCIPSTFYPNEFNTWCVCNPDASLTCTHKEPPTDAELTAAYEQYVIAMIFSSSEPVEQTTTPTPPTTTTTTTTKTTTISSPIYFEDDIRHLLRGEDEPCPRGIAYDEDCNHCHCDPRNGKVICHENPGCGPLIDVREKKINPPTPLETNPADTRVCTPNSRFFRDCNVCVCSETGFFFTCTKKLCPMKTNPSK